MGICRAIISMPGQGRGNREMNRSIMCLTIDVVTLPRDTGTVLRGTVYGSPIIEP